MQIKQVQIQFSQSWCFLWRSSSRDTDVMPVAAPPHPPRLPSLPHLLSTPPQQEIKKQTNLKTWDGVVSESEIRLDSFQNKKNQNRSGPQNHIQWTGINGAICAWMSGGAWLSFHAASNPSAACRHQAGCAAVHLLPQLCCRRATFPPDKKWPVAFHCRETCCHINRRACQPVEMSFSPRKQEAGRREAKQQGRCTGATV